MTASDRTFTRRWRDATVALRRQWRSLRSLMLLIYTPLVIAFGIVILARLRTGVSINVFTRDPLGFTDIPVYTGVLSHVGAMIWSGTAAVCFFTYGAVRTKVAGVVHPRFVLAGGLVTLVLLLDDVFLLHEVVFPRYLGIHQRLVFAMHAALIVGFLVGFRATILRTDFLLLGLALAGMGFSIGVDLIGPYIYLPGLYVFEDGAKLFGIINWAAYFVLISARLVMAGGDRGQLEHGHAAPHLVGAGEAR